MEVTFPQRLVTFLEPSFSIYSVIIRFKLLVIKCLLYYSFKFHNDRKNLYLSGHNEEIEMPKKRKSYEEDTSIKNIKVADGNENDNKSTRKNNLLS